MLAPEIEHFKNKLPYKKNKRNLLCKHFFQFAIGVSVIPIVHIELQISLQILAKNENFG